WLIVHGRVGIASASATATFPVDACVDLTDGAFHVDVTQGAHPVPITGQVSLSGTALHVDRDGTGHLSGEGTSTVNFSLNGTSQAVMATLALRADGSFLIT